MEMSSGEGSRLFLPGRVLWDDILGLVGVTEFESGIVARVVSAMTGVGGGFRE